MKELIIPKTLKLGSATAATQIEGGDKNCNWYRWSLLGKLAGGASSLTAADHYNRVKEDVELMRKMNQEVYRMSIEWSRFEPREGVWSKEGIEHYKNEIKLLIEAGIRPLVTLHHFSQPQWVEDIGAWTNTKTIDYFLRFVEKIVESIGEDVFEYCTINEPNVFVNDTYMDAKYPSGKEGDMRSYFKAARNLAIAHIRAYKLIHKMREQMGRDDTMVGIVMHIAHFVENDGRAVTKLGKKLLDYSFHKMFYNANIEGHFTFPLGGGYPEGKGIYSDFIGVNYYSRHLIHGTYNPAKLFGEVKFEENLSDEKLNDLGWEIYPEGIYKVCKKVYDLYKLPIYITENGLPDASDTKRAKFIYDHLMWVTKLIEDGVDVRGYYHWSLLDNLEWNDGYGPRFGLIEVDYETFERKIRKSGKFYSTLCKQKKITKEMIEEYINI